MYVAPTINCPIALPADPVPSIIPVMVDMALSLPFKEDYFPRSAAQTEEIILLRELMKKPWKKNRASRSPFAISKMKAVMHQLIIVANTTANKAMGERTPYMRSEA